MYRYCKIHKKEENLTGTDYKPSNHFPFPSSYLCSVCFHSGQCEEERHTLVRAALNVEASEQVLKEGGLVFTTSHTYLKQLCNHSRMACKKHLFKIFQFLHHFRYLYIHTVVCVCACQRVHVSVYVCVCVCVCVCVSG